MTISELKAIVDSIYDLQGPDARTSFIYQRASGRTGLGDITSYRVGVSKLGGSIHFNIDYPRGEAE